MEEAVLQHFVANWEWKVSQQTQLMEMMWHLGLLLMQEWVETQKQIEKSGVSMMVSLIKKKLKVKAGVAVHNCSLRHHKTVILYSAFLVLKCTIWQNI